MLPKKPRKFRLKVEDRWILSRMNSLIENYLEYFKAYRGHKAVQEIMNFILNDFSRWYIKLIRDRVWPQYEKKDKNAAFYALVSVTENLVKLLSPICPFVAEDIYQNVLKNFRRGRKSVHMNNLPKPNRRRIHKKLEEQMEIIKQIAEASNYARQKFSLKLRWPVKKLIVQTKNKEIKKAIKSLESVLLYICNVKSVKVVSKRPRGNFAEGSFDHNRVLLDLNEDKEIWEERLIRELIRKIQSMRKKNDFVVKDRIDLSLKSEPEVEKFLRKNKDLIASETGCASVDVGTLEGKYEGELVFKDKQIEIKFNKTKR